MAIDLQEIKRLRELTGVGMTDAKRALEESNGDFDQALSAMRKKGLTKPKRKVNAKPAKAWWTLTCTATALAY